MSKLFSGIVAVGVFIGWVVYLAGIAASTDLCTKAAKGTLSDPLIKSVGSADKYVPIGSAWDIGLKAAASSSSSSTTGRKMLSFDNLLFPQHGRQLLDTASNSCGWAYSFHWWTVALQGIATIGVLLLAFTSSESIAKLRPAFFAFLAVNTALLCGIASQLIPITYNANQIKAKGKGVDAVYASSAGILITLIFNFTWFISSSLEGDGAVQPVAK